MSRRRGTVVFVRGLLALGLLAPLLILSSGGVAQAHSSQTGSTPASGARLEVAPNQVVVTFDSPLMDVGAALVVRAADGSDVTSGPPEISRNEISVPVRTDVAGGDFTVAYRVVSQDGHTVTSTFDYTVLGGADPTPVTPASTTVASASAAAAGEEPASSGGVPIVLLAAGLLGVTVIVVGAIALRR